MKTPQISYPLLAEALQIPAVILKREDLHPYGSHKGRSIPVMIKHYVKEGFQSFCISSSGNAALAAIHTLLQHNKNNPGKEITLTVYIGEHIDKTKQQHLYDASKKSPHIAILQVAQPKQQAFQDDKMGKSKNLRQSTDDIALVGYHALAEELRKIEDLSDVFIPTSSGTTAQGLIEAFADKNFPIRVHIVQTTACHPIAEFFDTEAVTETSLASAIVDRVAHRKEVLLKLLQKNNGNGWTITDSEITDAINLVKKTCTITLSPNSALSVAGLQKFLREGKKLNGTPVCLITGE